MIDIDVRLVSRLVASQFPQWRDLPIRPVPRQGWDNRTFRLGDELTVRLPSAAGYVPAVAKEDRWLPRIAPHLPVPIPEPVAVGRPTEEYPYPWSVRRWLHGHPLLDQEPRDRTRLAEELAAFLVALRTAPVEGPIAGAHSFYRGCHPSAYGNEVQRAIEQLGDRIDATACHAIWEAGTTTVWTGRPVWFHGDVAVGNILINDPAEGAGTDRQGPQELAAMIDFGTSGVGDPASDLQIAWTYFRGEERQVFRRAVGLDDGCWLRARAWALWKELITLAPEPEPGSGRVLVEILADPVI